MLLAKSIASLDQLSDGRFIFAAGGGWNVEEMENHGARYDTRFRLLRESFPDDIHEEERAKAEAPTSTSASRWSSDRCCKASRKSRIAMWPS